MRGIIPIPHRWLRSPRKNTRHTSPANQQFYTQVLKGILELSHRCNAAHGFAQQPVLISTQGLEAARQGASIISPPLITPQPVFERFEIPIGFGTKNIMCGKVHSCATGDSTLAPSFRTVAHLEITINGRRNKIQGRKLSPHFREGFSYASYARYGQRFKHCRYHPTSQTSMRKVRMATTDADAWHSLDVDLPTCIFDSLGLGSGCGCLGHFDVIFADLGLKQATNHDLKSHHIIDSQQLKPCFGLLEILGGDALSGMVSWSSSLTSAGYYTSRPHVGTVA